jgi:hypothetical protein
VVQGVESSQSKALSSNPNVIKKIFFNELARILKPVFFGSPRIFFFFCLSLHHDINTNSEKVSSQILAQRQTGQFAQGQNKPKMRRANCTLRHQSQFSSKGRASASLRSTVGSCFSELSPLW